MHTAVELSEEFENIMISSNVKKTMPASSSGAQREKLNSLPYDLVPFEELVEAYVRVAEHGAVKYEPWNWSKGLSRVQLLCSLLRHTFAYLRGVEFDDGPKGSGLRHTDHILWNAVALVHNVHWGLEDGRRAEPPRDYKKASEAPQALQLKEEDRTYINDPLPNP